MEAEAKCVVLQAFVDKCEKDLTNALREGKLPTLALVEAIAVASGIDADVKAGLDRAAAWDKRWKSMRSREHTWIVS